MQPILPHTEVEIAALTRDAWGKLVLELIDGTRIVDIRPVRGFPITCPDYGISLVDRDGREAVWIARLSACPAEVRARLEEDLAARDFLPRIEKIHGLSSIREPCEWDVQTDRGRTRFVLKSDEDVRRLDARRAMITDAHGVQYLVPEVGRMDRVSRRYLERYL